MTRCPFYYYYYHFLFKYLPKQVQMKLLFYIFFINKVKKQLLQGVDDQTGPSINQICGRYSAAVPHQNSMFFSPNRGKNSPSKHIKC
jgi:hypothetical protein